MSDTNSTTEQATTARLTAEDLDQIAEGIECFIMNGDPNVDAIWQPYVDQLKAQRAVLAAAADLLAALKGILTARPELWGDQVVDGRTVLTIDADAADAADRAIAKAEGR